MNCISCKTEDKILTKIRIEKLNMILIQVLCVQLPDTKGELICRIGGKGESKTSNTGNKYSLKTLKV